MLLQDPKAQAEVRALRSENESLKTQFATLNPVNQPISAVSAEAEVMINIDKTENSHDFGLGSKIAIAKGSEALLFLSVPDGYEKTTEPGTVDFVAVFNLPPYGPLLGQPMNQLNTAEYIQLEFSGPEMPRNASITGGKVVFVINGGQRFEFPIPKQTADGKIILVRDLSPIKNKLSDPLTAMRPSPTPSMEASPN